MPELQCYDEKNRSLTWCLSLITESTSRMSGDARGDLWEAGLSTLMGEGTGDEELDARSSWECCEMDQERIRTEAVSLRSRNISNTRKSVSSDIQHWELVEKMRRSRVFFNRLQGVWILDETPFRMFDIASQTINDSRRKSKQKFTKFYDN